MSRTAGDFFRGRPSAWGIRRVIGFPGNPGMFDVVKSSARESVEESRPHKG